MKRISIALDIEPDDDGTCVNCDMMDGADHEYVCYAFGDISKDGKRLKRCLAAASRHKRMVEALKKLQWSGKAHGFMDETAPRCPECGGIRDGEKLYHGNNNYSTGNGHISGCSIAAILREEENAR